MVGGWGEEGGRGDGGEGNERRYVQAGGSAAEDDIYKNLGGNGLINEIDAIQGPWDHRAASQKDVAT